jgi:hypothetical protein
MQKTLLVRPVGVALVTNYEAMDAGKRCYIGREKVLDEKGNVVAFAPIAGPVEIPMTGDYLRHLADGDLEPADAETARLCGKKLPAIAPASKTSER